MQVHAGHGLGGSSEEIFAVAAALTSQEATEKESTANSQARR